MTREIKFRGKASGTWYFGNLQTRKISRQQSSAWIIGYDESPMLVSVDPSTVGQFTGLYDKNGKEIYEGDVVRLTGKTNETLLFNVDWHKHLCKFYLSFGEEQKVNDTKTDIFEIMRMGYNYEVIGNIHDNKELIEGGEK